MKNKIKKILTSTIISAVSVTAIGCSTTDSKLAKTIDKGMAEFVSSINNLDYVETTAKASSNDNIGKIVETSLASNNSYGNKFLNTDATALNIENTITKPNERNNDFKLYVLSESPYVTLTSDNNSSTLNMFVKFSTNKIEETSEEIDSKINSLILKRSILMIYVNEIYSGNVNISDENKVAINAYVNVIKENASFLNGNRGMVKNQLSLANDLINAESNENLVNYYIIKSGEALETRSSKIDSTISAIDSIIEILENNLTANSPYYQTQLSNTYESFIENLNSTNTSSTENKELADNIVDSLNLCIEDNNNSNNSLTNNSNTNNNVENNESQNNTNQNNLINSQPAENNTATNNETNTTPQTLSARQNNIQSNVRNLNLNQNNNLGQNLRVQNNSTTTNQSQNSANTQTNRNVIDRQQNSNNTNTPNTLQNSVTNNNTQSTNTISQNTNSRRRIARNNPANQSNINNNQNNVTNNNQVNQNQTNLTNNSQINQNQTNTVRRSRNLDYKTRNNSNSLNANVGEENNQNKAKEISNMENTTKIVRADRSREKQVEEQYTASRTSNMVNERAERVPYKSTTTFNQ